MSSQTVLTNSRLRRVAYFSAAIVGFGVLASWFGAPPEPDPLGDG